MTDYRPVGQEARQVAIGTPVVSTAAVRYNGDGGVRTEWWWAPGPVDSCCCCCTLRSGVGILAGLDVLGMTLALYFVLSGVLVTAEEKQIVNANYQYELLCKSGTSPSMAERCRQMKEDIDVWEASVDELSHIPFWFIMQEVARLLAGVIGLWAVFGKSAGAARIYMYSWPVLFLTGTIVQFGINYRWHIGLRQDSAVVVMAFIFNIYWVLYYTKVAWSYHMRLKMVRDYALANNAHKEEWMAGSRV